MSKNILLICGSGASSGFMAANMRKAAKKAGLDYKIQARSEAEFDAIKNEVPDKVKVILMKPDYYSILDGKSAIDDLKTQLEN